MKPNYQPWEINVDDFYKLTDEREKLKFLLKFAVLAPSSHNSQPWQFQIMDSKILIMSNFDRVLRISDPDNRYLFISIGCVLENIVVAADYYGFESSVKYSSSKNSMVEVLLKENVYQLRNISKNHLIFYISSRRSNRNKYNNRMPELSFLKKALSFNNEEVTITFISEEKKKNEITDLLINSRIKAFDNKDFRNELATYKRNNLTHSSLGMPGFTMGFSTPVSFFIPTLMRMLNIMRILKKSEEQLLKRYTPLFAVLSTKNNNISDWVKTGQILERLMLEAERYGIRSSMSAIPSQIEVLQNILGIKTCPQIFLRLGYTEKIPRHSPRMSINEILRRV